MGYNLGKNGDGCKTMLMLWRSFLAVARVPKPATTIFKFAVPVVFKFKFLKFIDNSTCRCYIYDTVKFIQINAKDQKVPWMLHYIK